LPPPVVQRRLRDPFLLRYLADGPVVRWAKLPSVRVNIPLSPP
jgi:hypothetical protein